MSTNLETTLPDGDYQTYDFNGHTIDLIPLDGDLWVTGEAIGTSLGYSDPPRDIGKLYKRSQKELQKYSTVVKLPTVEGGIQKRRSMRVYNEEGIMILTMLSRQPKAAEFRAWAVQILKAYRRGELIMVTPGERDLLLELCIKEAGKGNVAAMDTLITRYGHRPQIVEEQKTMLGFIHGRVQLHFPLPRPDEGGAA